MYKTLIMPHIDYSSQLWMPIDPTGIYTLEKLQRDYFRYIPEMKGMDYWESLKHLRMYSIQRRLERYRIIYCWKILEGKAPNCGLIKIEDSETTRQGRRLQISKLKGKTGDKKLREQSFQVHGAKLFNSLPPHIRNLTKINLDIFKSALDDFLQSIPDQPKVDGLVPGATSPLGQYSNSILDQVSQSCLTTGGA